MGGDSEVGGNEKVRGRDGGVNRRWAALAIHNSLQLQREEVDANKQREKLTSRARDICPRFSRRWAL